MRSTILHTLIGLVLVPCCLAAPASGQDYGTGPTTYYLHRPSSYQEGCWGLCACPLTVPAPMRGAFTLSLITVGDVTDFYSVTNVNWTVPLLGPSGTTLTGSGNFSAGQFPYANHQHMNLDLTLTPPHGSWTGVQHFFTTPEAGMRSIDPPPISIEIANSSTGCPGIRLRVVASRYRSDWDGDGTVGIPDIFAFLADYFRGQGDYTGDGQNNVSDIMAMLGDWFARV